MSESKTKQLLIVNARNMGKTIKLIKELRPDVQIQVSQCQQQRNRLLAACKMIKNRLLTYGEWDDGCFYYAGHSASELQEPLRLIEAAKNSSLKTK